MWRVLIFVGFLLLILSACDRKAADTDQTGKPQVVTTLFPLYDFTRNVGGDKVEVYLLLPPGMEAHTFEPKPNDIIRINRSSLFVYTNRYMEPWAEDIINGLGSNKTRVVNASRGTHMLRAGKGDDHDHDRDGHTHDGMGMDPHLWLDFDNARKMVDNICAGLVAVDPTNRDYYIANAAAYKAKLTKLDERFRFGLARCEKRVFLHGGHYAFGYLANRYGLRYESAYAITANAEPSPATITGLIKQMKANGLHYIYTEELVEPRIAETIARETGAKILMLHGAHNISRDDLASGATFLFLMERNLKNLETGLHCR